MKKATIQLTDRQIAALKAVRDGEGKDKPEQEEISIRDFLAELAGCILASLGEAMADQIGAEEKPQAKARGRSM
jgi:hypothetical protein